MCLSISDISMGAESYDWLVQIGQNLLPEDDIAIFGTVDVRTEDACIAYSMAHYPNDLPTLAPALSPAENLLIADHAPIKRPSPTTAFVESPDVHGFYTQSPVFTQRTYFDGIDSFTLPEDPSLLASPDIPEHTNRHIDELLPSTQHVPTVCDLVTPAVSASDTRSEAADSAIALSSTSARSPSFPASSPTCPTTPSPKRRCKPSAWTPTEDAAAITLMKEVIADDTADHTGRESRFALIAMQMQLRYGFKRGPASVKNQWNRYLRAQSGVEDRGRMKRSAGLVTSSLKTKKSAGLATSSLKTKKKSAARAGMINVACPYKEESSPPEARQRPPRPESKSPVPTVTDSTSEQQIASDEAYALALQERFVAGRWTRRT